MVAAVVAVVALDEPSDDGVDEADPVEAVEPVEAVPLQSSASVLVPELDVATCWVAVPVDEDEATVLDVVVAVAEPATVAGTAKPPVMARNEPTLTAAAVDRARLAGWGRLRRRVGPAGGVGAGGVGEEVASMGTTVLPVPGRSRRATGDWPGSSVRRQAPGERTVCAREGAAAGPSGAGRGLPGMVAVRGRTLGWRAV